MSYDELLAIGAQINAYIKASYPISTPEAAARAFCNFKPKEHGDSYKEYRMDFLESFVQAHIQSYLERQWKPSFKSIAPLVQRQSLADFVSALTNNDLALSYEDRDFVLSLIQFSKKASLLALEGILQSESVH